MRLDSLVDDLQRHAGTVASIMAISLRAALLPTSPLMPSKLIHENQRRVLDQAFDALNEQGCVVTVDDAMIE